MQQFVCGDLEIGLWEMLLFSSDVQFCLCVKDEEGRSGPFVDKIREQVKLEKTMYIKEIENALGGNR